VINNDPNQITIKLSNKFRTREATGHKGFRNENFNVDIRAINNKETISVGHVPEAEKRYKYVVGEHERRTSLGS
jgi:nuclear transport factor 2 (NTF2) superfamily protein